jgi:hypothetical protein
MANGAISTRITAILLAVSLAVAALGLGGWWWLQRKSPLQFQTELLHTPSAARYVPRKVNFSLYLQLNPEEIPAYGHAVAPAKQRKHVADALTELRNRLFAITTLNYNKELSDWIGSEMALALTTDGDSQTQPSWLLAISSRTPLGAREFLQRFWQIRSLAGGDLQISSYRGLGLISSSNPNAPLATALINDQLVLIASKKDFLEDALDSSQVDGLNQTSDPQLQNWLNKERKGVGLILSDATGINQILGLPAKLVTSEQIEGLVGSLALDGKNLQLTAQLNTGLDRADPLIAEQANQWLQQLRVFPNQLEITSNASAINNLLPNLITEPGPLLRELQQQSQGPLLLASLKSKDEWLAASGATNPRPADLDEPLHKAGYDPTSIDAIDVWSRLSGQTDREGKLKAILAGASGTKAGVRWWSNSLDALQNQLQAKGNSRNPAQLGASAVAILQLGPQPSRALLSHWSFWQGLQLVTAQPLNPAVAGMEYALEEDKTDIGLKATLRFS